MGKITIFIILIAGLIYANSLFNPFIWDDISLIIDNPYIKNPAYIAKIFTSDLYPFSYYKGNYYRPLQSLTYLFDYAFWKLNPIGYHISNIFFHSISAILVYLLISALASNKFLSLITALLFLVNPIHTEAITYISGRADSLAAIFILISLLFYIPDKTGKLTKRNFVISIATFIFALLSKETAIILPFAIILYDYYFQANKKIKERVLLYLPYFIILGGYASLRLFVLNFSHRALLNIPTDLLLRLITGLKSVFIYLGMLLLPFNLHMERTFPLAKSLFELSSLFSLIGLCLIMAYLIGVRKKHNIASFGCAWFLLNLIPVTNIFIPTNQIYIAEHWLYLPSIGFFLILGAILNKLSAVNKKAVFAFSVFLLLFYSFLTIKQNQTWRDPQEFYKRVLRFSPYSLRAYFNLGLIYEEKKEYAKAIEVYKYSLDVDANYFLARNNLGNIYAAQGLYDKALEQYNYCLQAEPNYFLAYNNMGNLYALKKEYNPAIESYNKSIGLNPFYSESHNNLALVYLENNDFPRAEKELKIALKLSPENASAHNNLGNLCFKKGLLDEAVKEYEEAIRLKDDFDKPHFNLGAIYFQLNLTEKAKKEWERVLTINPQHSGVLNNLKLLKNISKKAETNSM